MPLPEWSTTSSAARALAERLLAWRPSIERRAFAARGTPSDQESFEIHIPSPTADDARMVVARISDTHVQISFGSSLPLLTRSLEEKPEEICIETLEGIVSDRILQVMRTGFRTHPWEVVDTGGSGLEEVLGKKYRWGRYVIKSWSGESD